MISVIILTWNSEKYIKRCLASLRESLQQADTQYEVFVVDNGSKDQTVGFLEQIQKDFPFYIVRLHSNRGTSYARNIALKRAKGGMFLILDSDTEINFDAIKKLKDVLTQNEKIGIVAPKMAYSDGRSQISYKKFPTLQVKILKLLPVARFQAIGSRLEQYTNVTKDQSHAVDYCISACWLVSKKTVEKVGLFDERIFYAPEDVDYCLRVWLAGLQVVYYPEAKIIHHTQRVSHHSFSMLVYHIKGLLYYFYKYRYMLSRNRVYGKIRSITKERYPIFY